MLYFRVGKMQIPPMMMAMKCSFCPRMSEPGETVFVMETDPIKETEDGELRADKEFETMCPVCYSSIKDAALEHNEHLLYDFDFVVEGLRMAPDNLKEREF